MSKSQVELMSKSRLDCSPVQKPQAVAKLSPEYPHYLFYIIQTIAILYSEAVKDYFACITLR